MGTPPASSSVRPLRADAARNLDRILEAAREVFAERGIDAGVDEVARRAGVGKGTLYRRFPSKDDLMWAVVEGIFGELLATARTACTDPDPERGLRVFVESLLRLDSEHRPFFESAEEWFAGTDRSRILHEQLMEAVTPLVRRGQRAGVLREDLDPGDIPIVLHMLSSVASPPSKAKRDLTPQARERYVALVFDALRPAGPRAPLPGEPYDPFGC